ncbi:MAG: VWA domain-containing protein, partial [Bacteroidetes bacterium]|nr:VWA domain-containing protein [Bacteroidota bacterium]
MQWIFWVIAIVLAAGAGYWVYIADKRRAVPYPWLSALLRGLVVLLVLLLLLVPTITITRNETQKPLILFLQDNSTSIPAALGKDSAAYRHNAQQLISRLSDKYRVVQWAFGNTVQTDSIFNYRQQATDISMAIARAQDFFGTQNLGAVILPTDGRYNQGVNPLYQSVSLHSTLYTVAIGDSTAQKDLRITKTYANKTVSLNSQFEIRADIVATLCKGYSNNVQLLEAGAALASTPVSISSDKFDRSVSFTVKATKAGLHHYIITAPVADGEKNTANNRRDIFVEVIDEKKNILIVTGSPHPDVNAIKEALSGLEGYKVTVRTADNMPASLSDYQLLILHEVPS